MREKGVGKGAREKGKGALTGQELSRVSRSRVSRVWAGGTCAYVRRHFRDDLGS